MKNRNRPFFTHSRTKENLCIIIEFSSLTHAARACKRTNSCNNGISEYKRSLPLPDAEASDTTPCEDTAYNNKEQNGQSTVPTTYPVPEVNHSFAQPRYVTMLASRWALNPSLLVLHSLDRNTTMYLAQPVISYPQMVYPHRPPTRICISASSPSWMSMLRSPYSFPCFLDHSNSAHKQIGRKSKSGKREFHGKERR